MDPKKIEALKYDLRYAREFLADALRKVTELRNQVADEDAEALWNARVADLERLNEHLDRYTENIA